MSSRNAVLFKCFTNGVYRPDMVVLSIHRSAGGHQMDSCQLMNDPRGGNVYLQNLQIAPAANFEVEIVASVNGDERVVFWGKVTQQKVVIQDGNAGEHLITTARIEDFHFGYPIVGMQVYDELSQTVIGADCDQIVFNPIHERKSVGNRRDGQYLETNIPTFTYPETLPFDEVEQDESSIGQFWTLAEVVFYLCRIGNFNETYISNPTFQELQQTFSDEDIVRHLPLRNGLYLPKALDAVLEPFGYHWAVFLGTQGNRNIGIWKRGDGISERFVTLGVPLAPVQAVTNLAACDINFDASACYNSVEGIGSFIDIEATYELLRAWPASEDNLPVSNPDVLIEGHANFKDHQYTWRKWALNENGDYKGMRSGALYDDAHDFNKVTQEADDELEAGQYIWLTNRKRFRPTLSCDDFGHPIGQVQGCVVEYYNNDTGSRNGWQPITGMECMISNKECAVLFTGTHPPKEIVRQGTSAKVRVTATIRFDRRIRKVAVHQQGSPLSDVQRLVLDLRDRFHWRYVSTESQYHSAVEGGTQLANQADDREKLQEYVEEIRRAWDQASVNGPITLEGCDRIGYELGVAIRGIEGRQILFNSRYDNEVFPTIVGVTYDCQNQRTHLQLDQYRKAKLLRFAQDRQGIEGTA